MPAGVKRLLPNECGHPERRHKANGMCGSCYHVQLCMPGGPSYITQYAAMARYASSPKGREATRRASLKWVREHPVYTRANNTIQSAKRSLKEAIAREAQDR